VLATWFKPFWRPATASFNAILVLRDGDLGLPDRKTLDSALMLHFVVDAP
jgi:hypothetical protein